MLEPFQSTGRFHVGVSHFTHQVEIAGGGHAPILSVARGPAPPPSAGPRTPNPNTNPTPSPASDSYTSVLPGGYDDPFQCQEGMSLAPFSRIPYNPKVLSRQLPWNCARSG